MGIAQADTDICNMAISNLGSAKEIQSLDMERSQEANVCRRYYQTALSATLRDFPWGFARAVVPLSLVTDFRTNFVYPDTYSFSYQYPATAVMVRRIFSGNRTDALDTSVPFEVQATAAGSVILCDMDKASAEITTFVNAVERFPPDFVMAFSHLLSALIAPRLTAGDSQNLGAKMYQKYQLFLSAAQKNNLIESMPDLRADSDMIRARDW